jgi:hypothetical protein
MQLKLPMAKYSFDVEFDLMLNLIIVFNQVT